MQGDIDVGYLTSPVDRARLLEPTVRDSIADGLLVAIQRLYRLRKRPDAKRLLKIAEQWRPWRSAAALLLWHYRRSMPDWGPKPLKEVKEEAKAK